MLRKKKFTVNTMGIPIKFDTIQPKISYFPIIEILTKVIKLSLVIQSTTIEQIQTIRRLIQMEKINKSRYFFRQRECCFTGRE
ncbi:MAG: hypothetical protein EGP63_01445 [Bacteroides stercoris]|nr:hypothetical protein [Bacteroides stercoris]